MGVPAFINAVTSSHGSRSFCFLTGLFGQILMGTSVLATITAAMPPVDSVVLGGREASNPSESIYQLVRWSQILRL